MTYSNYDRRVRNAALELAIKAMDPTLHTINGNGAEYADTVVTAAGKFEAYLKGGEESTDGSERPDTPSE